MISNYKFSKNILNFNQKLKKINWRVSFPGTVFIRDYEFLPDKSPYDIDLLVQKNEVSKLEVLFKKNADENSLLLISKNSLESSVFIIFDLNIEKNRRNWIFFEIRTKYLIDKVGDFCIDKIDVMYKKNQLPIPTKKWIFFLYFHQYLRQRKNRHINLLKKIKYSRQDLNFTKKILSCNEKEIDLVLNGCMDTLNKKFLVYKKDKKKNSSINILKKKILQKIYFFRVKSNSLFTINGVDGAGKSSILNKISSIVELFPFEVTLIHHNKGGVKKNKPSIVTQKSFIRKVLSYVHYKLPNIVKEFWLYFTHYSRYSINMNSFVIKNTFSSKIIILDRYIYDLWAKDIVKRELSGLTISFVYNLFCRIIKFPSKAYFIYDDPKMIFKRKKELTEIQINIFQLLLNNIFNKIKVSFQKVPVKKRKPIDIAKQILRDIIKSNPDLLISIIKENPRF